MAPYKGPEREVLLDNGYGVGAFCLQVFPSEELQLHSTTAWHITFHGYDEYGNKLLIITGTPASDYNIRGMVVTKEFIDKLFPGYEIMPACQACHTGAHNVARMVERKLVPGFRGHTPRAVTLHYTSNMLAGTDLSTRDHQQYAFEQQGPHIMHEIQSAIGRNMRISSAVWTNP